MWLSDLSIRRPVMAVMMVSALVVFGAIGFTRLGISLFPNVEFPNVTATTTWRNADPETVEVNVTKILEDQIGQIEGIRHITSENRTGISRIVIEFELYRDIESATQDVRDKVAWAMRILPRDVDAPIVEKLDINAMPVMWLAVYGDRPVTELRELADDLIKPRIEKLPGVGSARVGGGRKREVRVWLYQERLAQLGVTVQDILHALQTQNIEIPAGTVETEVRELTVRTKARLENPHQFNDIIVGYHGGAPIRIRHVGYAEDGMGDISAIIRFIDTEGREQQAVGLGISARSGANAVAVSKAVKTEMTQIKQILPKDINIAISTDSSRFIERSIHEVESSLLWGALLASIAILFFLQNIRTAIISALAIPTSIISTFAFMYFMDFTLNNLSMLGLALAVGVVIDDAIIVIENIYRHLEEKKEPSRLEAARAGSREIAFAALAATLSLLAVFIPVAFMGGLIGRFFYEFGLTVAFSVAVSLFVAFTLTPMLASQWLSVGTSRFFLFRWFESIMKGLRNVYISLLKISLSHPILTVACAGVIFAISIIIGSSLGTELSPQEDQARFVVRLETPLDYSIEATDRVIQQASDIIREFSELSHFLTATGFSGAGMGASNTAIMFVTLKDRKYRSRSQSDVMADLRHRLKAIPDAFTFVAQINPLGMGFRSADIQYTIQGIDLATLDSVTQSVMQRLRTISGFVDVDRDLRLGKPEISIKINRDMVAHSQLSIDAIYNTVAVLMGGVDAGDYVEGGRNYDVYVKAINEERNSPSDLNKIYLKATDGSMVSLSNFIQIVPGTAPNIINRTDRQRSVTLFANLEAIPMGAALGQLEETLREILPEGYYGRRSGNTELLEETFFNIFFALGLAAILAYMVLASQFNSFIQPFIVMLTLPLAIVGALGSIWIMHQLNLAGLTNIPGMTVNMLFMIGIILLVGLVTKNAILLLDYTNQLRSRGRSVEEALMEACPIRLRPILMTATSTMAAAIPIILGLGEGSETRRPMALAIFGGMLTSTLLTLLVIPCMYLLVTKLIKPHGTLSSSNTANHNQKADFA